MKHHRQSMESGIAALEFVIVSTLVFGLLALSIPLIVALQERIRLERVAGHTARFATAAPDRPRFGSEKRRPTIGEVEAEALRAYSAIGGPSAEVNFTVKVTGDPRMAHPGEPITITLTKTVNLGAMGKLLDLINVTSGQNVEMEINAVGRQE